MPSEEPIDYKIKLRSPLYGREITCEEAREILQLGRGRERRHAVRLAQTAAGF